MGKRDKYAKQAAAIARDEHKRVKGLYAPKSLKTPEPEVQLIPLKVGDHQFPVFEGGIFNDAKLYQYPQYDSIPLDFRLRSDFWSDCAQRIFHSGASLEDLGIEYNTPEGVDSKVFWMSVKAAMRALLQSWDPSHDHKIATVAWCMSEWFKKREIVE